MILEHGTLWAGSESSYQSLILKSQQLNADMVARIPNLAGGVDLPYRITPNGTAIIPIQGAMVNRDYPEFFMQFFGACCYPHLQRQFASAANNPDVKRVLLDVNSGGGQVSGLGETLEALRELNTKKPVATYVSDFMASAAYWLASASSKIGIAQGATLGSIGIIAVHVGQKRALIDEGYDPVVLRAGTNKHLGHPLEDFSDEAKAAMQQDLNFHHQRFIDDIAANRKNLSAGKLSQIADGSCFYGKDAVKVGLADVVTTFSKFLAEFEADKASTSKRGTKAAFEPLTTQAITENNNGDNLMDLEQAQARIAELEAQTQTQAEAQAALSAKLSAAEATNTALSASLASASANLEDYANILDDSIKVMATAMNVEVVVPDDLAAKKAYHAQLQEKFQAKFPAGGVAVPQPDAQAQADNNLPEWFKDVKKGD